MEERKGWGDKLGGRLPAFLDGWQVVVNFISFHFWWSSGVVEKADGRLSSKRWYFFMAHYLGAKDFVNLPETKLCT